MERRQGQLAVVTGAGSGIGAAISTKLLEHGLRVIALDLKFDGLSKFENIQKIKCDLSSEREVDEAWDKIKSLGPVHVLVNNAGVIDYSPVIDSKRSTVERLVSVNIVGTAHCTSRAVQDMKLNHTEGHIFMVNSVLGHKMPEKPCSNTARYSSFNVYPACKHATVALTESVRWELKQANLPIRITSLSPGLVKTNIASNCKEVEEFFDKIPCLDPSDIASALIYALSTPPEVEVSEITIRRRGEFP